MRGLALDRVGSLHPPARNGSDGTTHCIHVWRRGQRRTDCIWGEIENIVYFPGWENPPPDMVRIWKTLAHFSSARAQPFESSLVEVKLFPAAACTTPVPWPANWPRQGQRGTWRNRGAGWAFSGQLYRPVFDRFFPHQDAWEK